ncbi:MAG: Ankyrin repeats (3 copies) [Syntrophorhabdus sp. PtaB.Bin027]|nr:MAG: Ankyrin repeats (3 copies) [Syntrophorhabdus sp. PtaB.Bin027]
MQKEFKLKMPTLEEIQTRQFEENIFELVAHEIQSGIKRSGIWAKAISEAIGDEMVAKSLYIRYRAQSMIDEVYLAEEEKRKSEETKVKRELEEKDQKKKIELATNDLFYAAEYGRNQEIKNLMDLGVNVNVQRTDGVTPLYLAASNGHKDAVTILTGP